MNTIDRDELFIDSRDEYRYSSSSISIDDDDDDDVRSASTTETNGILKRIEKFVNNCQDNYTIKVRPDYRIKFKHEARKVGNVCVKVDVSANAVFDYRLELEPKILSTKVDLDGNKKWYADPIKKIELSVEDFEFDVFSKRFNVGEYFTLQAIVGYKHRPEDAEDSKFSFNYRLASRHWDRATKNLRKFEVNPHEKISAAIRWDVEHKGPSIEGKIGSSKKKHNNKYNVDVGCYHVTIPRLDLKIDI